MLKAMKKCLFDYWSLDFMVRFDLESDEAMMVLLVISRSRRELENVCVEAQGTLPKGCHATFEPKHKARASCGCGPAESAGTPRAASICSKRVPSQGYIQRSTWSIVLEKEFGR